MGWGKKEEKSSVSTGAADFFSDTSRRIILTSTLPTGGGGI